MSNFLIAFLVSLGATAWIYSKMMRQTGGNSQNALIVAGIGGVVICAIIYMLATMIPS